MQRGSDSSVEDVDNEPPLLSPELSTFPNAPAHSMFEQSRQMHENRVQLARCFLNGKYTTNLSTGCAIGEPSQIPLPQGFDATTLKKIFPHETVVENSLRLPPSFKCLAVIASPEIMSGDISKTDISTWYTIYTVRQNDELLVRIISSGLSKEKWTISRLQWNYLKGSNCEQQENLPSPITFATQTQWNEDWNPSVRQKELLDLYGPQYYKQVSCRCSDCLELNENYDLKFATALKDYSLHCYRIWIMQSCNACKKLLDSPNFDLPITLRQLIFFENEPTSESKKSKEEEIALQQHLRLFGSRDSSRSWYPDSEKWMKQRGSSAVNTHKRKRAHALTQMHS